MVLIALTAVPAAPALAWTQGAFEELSHDFGSVPRGQTVTHPFRVINNTNQNMVIGQVRVSCGLCSSARAAASVLAPGQETAILVSMHTGRFQGVKAITVYVQFNQPRFEEIRLNVQANSRDDVSFFPESLNFGKIKRGTSAAAQVNVSFFGDGQTKVLEARSDSNYIQPVVKEVRRQAGEAAYEVSAKIRPDTPAGKWYTDIWLKTSNPSLTKLRVPVVVEVEAPVALSPNRVSLGQVKAGQEVERRLILRGARPFRITGILGADDLFQVQANSNESKTVHVLTLTLNPEAPGAFSRTVRVTTDLPAGGDVEFQAQAEIMP